VLARLNASNLTARNVEEWKEKLKIKPAATIDNGEETEMSIQRRKSRKL
jgi:hypothetical protein